MNRWPILALIAALTACGPQTAREAARPKAFSVQSAAPQAGGGLSLSGEAAAGAQIVEGAAVLTRADAQGRWTYGVAATPAPRVLRLSARSGGVVQAAPGPLVLLPGGRAAALLRPGDGAVWFGPSPGFPTRIEAIDYDEQGGVIVSGRAPAGADILIRVGQTRRGGGDADATGRFSIVLESALSLGRHAFEVSGGAGEDEVALDLAPPRSPAPHALASTRAGESWRIDWLTPSGAVQTTLLPGAAR